MNLYKITNDPAISDTVKWAGTLDDAKDACKAQWPTTFNSVRVELWSLNTDKEALLALLNHGEPVNASLQRTWKLTPRGGLADCANGE